MTYQAAYNYDGVDIKLANALWALGYLRSDDLPKIAEELKRQGNRSAALSKLADEPGDGPDNRMLFEKAMVELEGGSLGLRTAVLEYAYWISGLIGAGDLTPYEGAKVIWEVADRARVKGTLVEELNGFIYAASEYEDRQNDQEMIAEAIAKKAATLLRDRRSSRDPSPA